MTDKFWVAVILTAGFCRTGWADPPSPLPPVPAPTPLDAADGPPPAGIPGSTAPETITPPVPENTPSDTLRPQAAPLGGPAGYAWPSENGGTWGAGPAAGIGGFWAPGGYEARIGSPYHYFTPGGGESVVTGNPYYDHYGPGFQRHSLHGHYRFPYYNYRAPWYYPGRAVYNRDTNMPW